MFVVGHDPVTLREIVAPDDVHGLVLGPPRSGKTSGKLMPSIFTHRGPLVVASSKTDIFDGTRAARSSGPVWVLSPQLVRPRPGVRQASWSPLPGCANWEVALLRARSLTTAEGNRDDDESSRFFRSSGERVLAAMLHAAAVAHLTMSEVALWLLLQDLAGPLGALHGRGSEWAQAILAGVDASDPRLRDSVLATASETMRVYDSDLARAQADGPLIDIDEFLAREGTIFVIAPSELQQLFAPVIVGLLEEVKRRTYSRHRRSPGSPSTLLVLDEADKISPWPGLPGVLGEGGGQGLQVLACFQDLSVARQRWGRATDGFATLFQHKVLLPGVADHATLHALSAVLGEEPVPGASLSAHRPAWPPHRLAAPPPGMAVHINGVTAGLVAVVTVHAVTP